MGRLGVSITKSTSWRGVAQEFSNTYYYEVVNQPNATVANEIIDALVVKEKAQFSANNTFVRAKAWSAGGSKAENQMLVQKNLTGTGTPTGGSTQSKEHAYLVRIRAGNDSRGNPVYLRKWWHLDVTLIAGSSITNGMFQGTAQLNQSQRDALVAFANDIKSLTLVTNGFTTATLVAKNGRQITGDTVAHPYVEHHQLGDMWR